MKGPISHLPNSPEVSLGQSPRGSWWRLPPHTPSLVPYRGQAVGGARVLAGLNGGDATQSVVAPAAGALNPPAGAACEEKGGFHMRPPTEPPSHPYLPGSVS